MYNFRQRPFVGKYDHPIRIRSDSRDNAHLKERFIGGGVSDFTVTAVDNSDLGNKTAMHQ